MFRGQMKFGQDSGELVSSTNCRVLSHATRSFSLYT